MNNNLIRRSDIWIANLKKSDENILSGKHPCIILSNWKACNKSNTIQILPITSKDKLNIPAHVEIGKEHGLDFDSTVLCEQIRTINKDALINKIGYCDQDKMEDIQDALNQQLGYTSKLNVDVFKEIQEKINEIEELNRYLKKRYNIRTLRERDGMIKCLNKFCLNNGIRLNLAKYTEERLDENVG
ncbi:type II toxin-antitoxin system PemK/MazF family toxin [Clostridium estertheticum]|uniref:type II toxin-antitoxin system PemK/MazF family toxin n=1 Tax=Clostridium estertheticum TaxID=238834 RepID=UPI001C0E63DE|nr:type II toxin-antitoxin system PemK/MazF family toxin [Clostridium estertheticum]MBU3186603.1 type II toxin-antitoxin system PemK/MazF family toxin [Clostridium estertheticum]